MDIETMNEKSKSYAKAFRTQMTNGANMRMSYELKDREKDLQSAHAELAKAQKRLDKVREKHESIVTEVVGMLMVAEEVTDAVVRLDKPRDSYEMTDAEYEAMCAELRQRIADVTGSKNLKYAIQVHGIGPIYGGF